MLHLKLSPVESVLRVRCRIGNEASCCRYESNASVILSRDLAPLLQITLLFQSISAPLQKTEHSSTLPWSNKMSPPPVLCCVQNVTVFSLALVTQLLMKVHQSRTGWVQNRNSANETRKSNCT
jgi:hypothetical protein